MVFKMTRSFNPPCQQSVTATVVTVIIIIASTIGIYLSSKLFKKGDAKKRKTILAFFHPHCDSGGGGERVLWVIIDALLRQENLSSKLRIIIYSSTCSDFKSQILAGVNNSFRIDITKHFDKITFVHIKSSTLLDAKWYPVATMLFQSLASVIVGLECLARCPPGVYCDTMGAAFTYPFAKLSCKCPVVAYTHYPIISSDMLQRVRDQRPTQNNSGIISGNVSISAMKLVYYKIFACMYSFVGSFADKVIVNSTWTENHISQLWKLDIQTKVSRSEDSTSDKARLTGRLQCRKLLHKVYPPCNTDHLQGIPIGNEQTRKRVVLSIGQFRPEKDHSLQLRAFRVLLDTDYRFNDVQLVMMGSTRNEDDRALVLSLKAEAAALGVANNTVFVVNAPFHILHGWLCSAQVGLHTMWNEHFGISVVEMMAAGLVTVAHNSGGPLLDLIIPEPVTSHPSSMSKRPSSEDVSTGYLASTPSEYAACIGAALDTHKDSLPLRLRARKSSLRFSDEKFMSDVVEVFSDIIK